MKKQVIVGIVVVIILLLMFVPTDGFANGMPAGTAYYTDGTTHVGFRHNKDKSRSMRLSFNKNVIERWLSAPMSERGTWEQEYKGTDSSPTTRGIYHCYLRDDPPNSDPRSIFIGDPPPIARGRTFDGMYSQLVFNQEISVWRKNGSYDTIELMEFKPAYGGRPKKFSRTFKNKSL